MRRLNIQVMSPHYVLWFETMYKVIPVLIAIDQLVDKEKTTALTEIENRSLGGSLFYLGMAHFLMAYRYNLQINKEFLLYVMKIL